MGDYWGQWGPTDEGGISFPSGVWVLVGGGLREGPKDECGGWLVGWRGLGEGAPPGSCRVARKQGQCPIGFVQYTDPGAHPPTNERSDCDDM